MKLKHGLAGLFALAGLSNLSSTALADPDPFIGQIQITAVAFCPRGWADLNGQIEAISQNTALFSLIGTTYGGDGRTTYALPEARGRALIGVGTRPGFSGVNIGAQFGIPDVRLTETQMPSHSHQVYASSAEGEIGAPANALLGQFPATSPDRFYAPSSPPATTMHTGTLANAGSPSPSAIDVHQPSVGIRHCIAQFGRYPSRS